MCQPLSHGDGGQLEGFGYEEDLFQEGGLASSWLEAEGIDPAFLGEEETPDIAEEGGFAGAIAAEESADGSWSELEV
jgi:hypothetical protein